jgi:hypothetical protein
MTSRARSGTVTREFRKSQYVIGLGPTFQAAESDRDRSRDGTPTAWGPAQTIEILSRYSDFSKACGTENFPPPDSASTAARAGQPSISA